MLIHKIFIIIAATLVFLTGCASSMDLRSKQPILQLTSPNSTKDVAGCIGDYLDSLSIGSHNDISTRPTAAGYSIILESIIGGYGKDTALVIDISESRDGSETLVFSNLLQRWEEKIIPAVKKCQVGPSTSKTNLDEPKSKVPTTAASSTSSDISTPSSESVEIRLTKAKSLYERGLITEQQYNDKRNEILKGL